MRPKANDLRSLLAKPQDLVQPLENPDVGGGFSCLIEPVPQGAQEAGFRRVESLVVIRERWIGHAQPPPGSQVKSWAFRPRSCRQPRSSCLRRHLSCRNEVACGSIA